MHIYTYIIENNFFRQYILIMVSLHSTPRSSPTYQLHDISLFLFLSVFRKQIGKQTRIQNKEEKAQKAHANIYGYTKPKPIKL